MAYDSRVYRVLIASPSDVEEERSAAVGVIQEWNDLHSHAKKITLLPLRWETHTSPHYGSRPQEVINRMIVDECDLVVGIFWTRLGSPTGIADSGTLEEIDRAGKTHKPIMLYFSKIGRDPDEINLEQMQKLQEFKKRTYPRGLVEHYKSHIDFRDKFSRQLELQVRELQKEDSNTTPTVMLEFLDLESRGALGSRKKYTVRQRRYKSLDAVPAASREKLASQILSALAPEETVCIPLAISNLGSSGIQSLFVELSIESSSASVKIAERLREYSLAVSPNWVVSDGFPGSIVVPETGITVGGPTGWTSTVPMSLYTGDPALESERLNMIHQVGEGWKLLFEWTALQPRRTRMIEPLVYARVAEPTTLRFTARVFADSFAEPVNVHAEAEIDPSIECIDLDQLAPNWRSVLGA